MCARITCRRQGQRRCKSWRFSLANACCVLDHVRPQVAKEEWQQVVGRMSFFVNAGMHFITELCKMRAFAELWDEITRKTYGVSEPRYRRFRYGVQVNSLGLTEQQPEKQRLSHF